MVNHARCLIPLSNAHSGTSMKLEAYNTALNENYQDDSE